MTERLKSMHFAKILKPTNPAVFIAAGLLLFIFGYSLDIVGSGVFFMDVPIEYFINYKYEFIKRGLVGEAFRLSGIHPTREVSFAFGIVVFFLLLLSVQRYFYRTLAYHPEAVKNVFLTIFLISPATCMHFGLDFGRFEQINIIITMVGVALAMQGKLLLTAPLVVIGFLIHEGFLFIGFPLIAAIAYHEQSPRNRGGVLLFVFALAAMTLVMVAIKGGFENITKQEFLEYVGESIPGYIYIDQIIPQFMSLRENVDLTLSAYRNPKIAGGLLVVAAYLLLITAVYLRLFFNKLDVRKFLVVVSPFSVFPLFFLGIDFYRWASLIVFEMFITSAFIIGRSENTSISIGSGSARFAIVAISCFSILGPIGIYSGTGAFPLFSKYPSLDIFTPLF